MTDKMIRFLNSININNIDDFDMDFDNFMKNRFEENSWIAEIYKLSPWNYELLRKFQDGIMTITTYQLTIRFSYACKIKAEDALNLFPDWYQTIYRLPSDYECEIRDGVLTFIFRSEQEEDDAKARINDFRDFLSFLNYDVRVETVVEEVEQAVVLSERKMKMISKAAEKAANELMEEEDESSVNDAEKYDIDIQKIIETQHQEETALVESQLLKQMRENAELMKKERERARLNRRGNYIPIDLIDTIDASTGSVDFSGKIFEVEIKEFGGRKRINIGVGDKAMGAIYVNMYENAQVTDEIIKELKKGQNVRVRGVSYLDEFTKNITIKGHYIDLLPPDEPRQDTSEEKRVELHLHSLMSVQDGVGRMDDYCKLATSMGHKAIAITDHGVVQGYPDAQAAAKATGIKMLYGSELYMVDDKQVYVFNPKDVVLSKSKFVVLDLETTGLSTFYDRIIEFGAVKVERGLVTSSLDILINPGRELSDKISKITHITNKMLSGKPKIEEAIDKILDFIGDAVLVTHNAAFDFGFIQEALKRMNRPILDNPVVDTLAISRYLFPEARSHTLGSLCRNMEVIYDEEAAHRADYDASVLNEVWQQMLVKLTRDNHKLTHAQLGKLETPLSLLKHIRPVHVVALAKDKQGLKDLYKLISLSHVDYLAEVPKVPRNELEKLREHLIIGSACFNGEVFRTARYYNFERLKQVVDFYDYIEVQPLENYSWLINMGELEDEGVLKTYIKDIIKAADEMHKPVCATGDCHYVNPEDKVYRDIYISAKAVGGTNHPLNPYNRIKGMYGKFENPDQHFRSTDEMIECFKWLEDDNKVKEIVITNTNMIADQIETLVPLPNDKLYTPTIDNCENMLKDMVYQKAHELYGDPLPEYIENRLAAELNGIISNGFSVIYYIAHKIVKKANDDGYLVGSRGSVGSSLVATMADITEVNPLPPHYRCPHCKHLEWTSEIMPSIRSGYDLPEKDCPVCGTKMVHDGQDIPFETFLGFSAEKVPDIDLNFPGDYQSKAHDYTKELLGEQNVFRAGTIETVAEKTAFGFARGYIERQYMQDGMSEAEAKEKALKYPKAKLSYMASGCVDVKRTTGQHPGGIVVIPREYEVYDFTPVQYPADEKESSWKTTHFDFHSIHDTILKLDLLGHVDPMALKMMCELTHINVKDIPMNDPKVLSIFSTPKELNIKGNYLNQSTGAMAIPEFGTNFVRGILEDTRPKTFSELVIISGLSHGTNVWNGNAEKLIHDKVTDLNGVIGCRDDIMTYLRSKGISNSIAFQIMETVRKGKPLKKEFEDMMRANGVPEWYLNSCKQIAYLFPKGHATAYVMMAIRVGYFKVYYPLEFYATFFSVRSKQYDIKTMIDGELAIKARLDELKLKSRTKGEALSPKEEEIQKTLNIAVEMVERGYKFSNISLYKSEATKFVVDHENKSLIPPFTTLDGLGEAAAESVVEARKDGEFFSKDDLLRRTKLNNTNIKDLEALHVLDDLSQSDQLTLFDF